MAKTAQIAAPAALSSVIFFKKRGKNPTIPVIVDAITN
jgi:hypothetical protein